MSEDVDEQEQLLATAPDVEDEAEETEEEPVPFTYEITSYGADYTVDSLVQRMNSGDIAVPNFQRDLIWNKRQRDRFVESLLLGLPVPGIFLSRDAESRLLVLDGQQRLRTLQAFYAGEFGGRPFALDAVQERFRGRTTGSCPPTESCRDTTGRTTGRHSFACRSRHLRGQRDRGHPSDTRSGSDSRTQRRAPRSGTTIVPAQSGSESPRPFFCGDFFESEFLWKEEESSDLYTS